MLSWLTILIVASTACSEPPASVPSYPDLRYIIHYRATPPEFFDFLEQSRTNFLHWHGPFSGYTGLMPREDLPRAIESVRGTVQQAHDRGAPIICYIGPCFSYGNEKEQNILFDFWRNRWDTYQDLLGERPADLIDCTQRDANGTPRPYEYKGSKGYHLCVNSPGVRQYTKGLIRLICMAGADGSFYDGPYVTQGNCYCPWCREKFRGWLADTYSPAVLRGMFRVDDPASVEPPTEASDPLWLPWRKFAAWTLWDFMRDTKEYAQSIKPDYIMTANYCMWSGEPYGPLRGSAENMELWSQVLDVVFDEAKYGAGPRTENGNKISNAVDYRYLLAASHGKPVALLKTAPEVESPEAQANLTRLAIAEGVAQGAAWQFHYLEGPAAESAIDYNAFLAANAEELRGARPHTNVGLLASIQQGYLGLASYPCAVSRELADQHIDHRMLIDEDVANGSFDDLDAIILPETRMLSRRQCEALKAYARGGGGLVVLGQCGDIDEWGRSREKSLAAELLRRENGELPSEPRRAEFGRGRVGFIPHVALPSSGNLPLSAQQQAGLSELPELVARVAGDLALRVSAPSSVEATAMYGPGDPPESIFVHLVNYDVDLDGNVNPPPEIGLRVRLPDDTDAGVVEVQSPDPGAEGQPLDFVYKPGPHRYVQLGVPNLHIYSRVAVGLKPVPLYPARGSLGLTAPPTAAPGARISVTIDCDSEGTAEKITPERVWWDQRALRPVSFERRGSQVFASLSVPENVQPGDLCVLGVSVPSYYLSDWRHVRIIDPLTVSLASPARVAVGMGPVALTAKLANATSKTIAASVRFDAPEGWECSPRELKAEVSGSKAIDVRTTIRALPEAELGLCELSAHAEWRQGGAERQASATARVKLVEEVLCATCRRTDQPPKIDGTAGDDCWQGAPAIGGFTDVHKQAAARQGTTVRLLYDDSHLYALFECAEAEPDSTIGQIKDDGGEVWRDDSVELFFDINCDRQSYSQFVVNVLGARHPKSPDWQAAVGRTQQGWVAEVAIPLEMLAKAGAGDVWGFNACRNRPARPQAPPANSSWAPVDGSYHQPARWGYLVFAE